MPELEIIKPFPVERTEAIERFLAVARALLFVREEPRDSNAGQAVEAIQKVTGNKPPDPWCASAVAFCGVSAFGTDWPLPKTAACQSLYEYGAARGLIVETPQRGDLLLIYFPTLRRFAHVAIVEEVKGGQLQTLEGNTNDGGSRDGWGFFRRTRTAKPADRFLRWV